MIHDRLIRIDWKCFFIGIICSITLFSCYNQQVNNLKKYYFNQKELKEGIVYVYAIDNNFNLGKEFWYFKQNKEDVNLFDCSVFDQSGFRRFKNVERWNKSGITLERMTMKIKDTLGNIKEIDAQIRHDDIFPFRADQGGIFLFCVSWKEPFDTSTNYILYRNRIFMGDTIMDMGNKHIFFEIKNRIENIQEGTLGLDTRGIEIYEKNKGLIYFTRQMDNDLTLKYYLDTTLKKRDFEKTYGFKLE